MKNIIKFFYYPDASLIAKKVNIEKVAKIKEKV